MFERRTMFTMVTHPLCQCACVCACVRVRACVCVKTTPPWWCTSRANQGLLLLSSAHTGIESILKTKQKPSKQALITKSVPVEASRVWVPQQTRYTMFMSRYTDRTSGTMLKLNFWLGGGAHQQLQGAELCLVSCFEILLKKTNLNEWTRFSEG